MERRKWGRAALWCFLIAESVLYYLILTTGGKSLVASEYGAIVLCFLFALGQAGKHNWMIPAALGCTVGADFFLVVCSPIRQLEGMVCFLAAQLLYAVHLHRMGGRKPQLVLRLCVVGCAMAAVFLVLGKNTDALALVSLCYYANLIVNILVSFARFRERRLLSVAFVLFLLCDTVIGLQMANGVYFPIPEGSLLHRILSVDFNLAWAFYLPSQVMIALSSRSTATAVSGKR